MEPEQIRNPLLLFDGYCKLCSGTVDFIIKRDKKKIIRYAPLQSTLAKSILVKHGKSSDQLDTVYFLFNSYLYQKSEAFFEILKTLGGWWKILLIFKIFPPSLNDFFYDLIARSRYKIFGKRDYCRIPTSDEIKLFID